MSRYKLPPLKVGGLYRVKGWKDPFDPSVVKEYCLADYRLTRGSRQVTRETNLKVGSFIMVVKYHTGRHPLEALVEPETGYCVDLIYNDLVYSERWYYLNEWQQRFEEVKLVQ